MAKIHNPQDQDGNLLINQIIFNEEVNGLKAADATLQVNINDEVTAREVAVSDEVTARKNADDILQANIDAEIERATSIESVLSTVIEDEIERARQKGDELQGNINDEVTERKKADSILQSAINTEKDRAMNAELNLTVALSDEITRAQEAESALNDSLAAEVLRATEKENHISVVIDGEAQIFSTDKLTAGTYSSTLNKPSAINIHNSIFPVGIIKSIEIPNANITSARHLSVKVVDGLSDTIVDYTSSNTSTTKWNFNKFIKKRNISDNVYYKLVLSDAAGNSSNLYFGNISYNNGNFANCGFGGNWPNPDSDLTEENGATGLTRINIEFEPNLNDTIQNTKENIISIIDTLAAKVDEQVEALNGVDAKIDEEASRASTAEAALRDKNTNLETRLLNEIKRAEEAETSIMSCLNQVTGHNAWTSLTERPSTTVEATAFEVKGASNLSNIVGKKIKSIDIMVDNTVSTPHYLAIYEDNNGTKAFKGVSSGSVWAQGKTAKFIFETPLVVSDVYEAYIISDLSHAVKPTTTTPPTKPDVVLKMYARANNDGNTAGNYRNANGTWNNGKHDFYITYHFEATRLDEIESAISVLEAKDSAIEAKIDALPHHEDNRYKFMVSSRNISGPAGDGSSSGTIVLTLNKEDAQIITANATYNSKQLEPQINGNELTLQFTVESTDSTGNIIINTICDSVNFDNAQYVCYVEPIDFTV
jgi:hypothetical protein